MENVGHKNGKASNVSHRCAIRSNFGRFSVRIDGKATISFQQVLSHSIYIYVHIFFSSIILTAFPIRLHSHDHILCWRSGKMGFICFWHKQPFPRHIFNQLHISPKMNCANFLKNEDREWERASALNAFGILFQFTWSLVFVALWTALDVKVWHR